MEWPDLIIEELVRCGVTQFFVAPGARSTPLVMAVAGHAAASTTIHFDERGTAFAALGFARATGRPAAWITTSGTALANGLPAVVEASTDGVPMILLTADRPPELRSSGANQTIIQPGIFGRYVRWSFDMPVPDQGIDPAFVLTTVDQAVHRARAESGPVHLNCMYRNPHETIRGTKQPERHEHIAAWADTALPYTIYSPVVKRVEAAGIVQLRGLLSTSTRPVIVLGRALDTAYEERVVEWARMVDIPVLPDVSSLYRTRAVGTPVISYWDLLLSVSDLRTGLQPDLIVQFGRGTVSTGLDRSSAKRVVVDSGHDRYDPTHRVSLRLTADSDGVCALLEGLGGAVRVADSWLESWLVCNQFVSDSLSERLGTLTDSTPLMEEHVAHILTECCESGDTLVLGNSLTVRHVDRYATPVNSEIRAILNRGASGIDGTIAVAAGVHAATGQSDGLNSAATQSRAASRVAVVLGDQALLHDMNSLALARDEHLIVVVINNNGGRIFHRFPISDQTDIFERFFVDPRGYTFEHAARQFRLNYFAPDSVSAFRRAFTSARRADDATLIEVVVDFGVNERQHRKFAVCISDSLSDIVRGLDLP